MLWVCIWSPYAIIVFLAGIGSKSSITPLVSQLPCFFAKLASCLNPIVYAISHPKKKFEVHLNFVLVVVVVTN
jgi:r-opsin